jgi:hypothetical protein
MGAGSGAVAVRWVHRGARAAPASAPASAGRPTGPFTPQRLAVQDAAPPDAVTVTWTDPSGGTATPVVVLSTDAGRTVVTATLRPGTTTYTPHGLTPGADYCALVALYPDPADTSAVAVRACLRHRRS